MARILVTGSAQGIGAETARQLVALGHQVVVHGRDPERASAALTAVPGSFAAVAGDLASLDSTRDLAEQANRHGPYDAIVHNAGVGGGSPRRELTADGLERIFHTNVAGPYALTCLMPIAPRMVYLTSGLEAGGVFEPDDLQWDRRDWDGMQAYSDSKLHDVMLAFELAARHPESVVSVVDPGWIQTRMGGPNAWDPVDLGAETQVWLACSDDPDALLTGRYLKRREELSPNPIALDTAQRAALTAELERLTGHSLP